jgi:serine/threonine protein kinase
VVLYEMATGRQPFERETTGSTFGAILYEAPVPPVRLNSHLPPRLEAIISKALERTASCATGPPPSCETICRS